VAAVQTVVVVAETNIYRQGIAAHLRSSRRFRVLESCSTDNHPVVEDCDCYIVDVTDPVLEGQFDALCRSLSAHDIPVIACGLASDDEAIVSCLEVGASAYVTKADSLEELQLTVTTTLDCGACIDNTDLPAILARLRSRSRGGDEPKAPQPKDPDPLVVPGGAPAAGTLTSREVEVVELVGQCMSNKEIAAHLGISEHTVKHHVHHLMAKLDVSRRGQAIAALRQLGT
jgi:DNA-binding NarL/FixJ family response regulator